jgi:hypothetical protein
MSRIELPFEQLDGLPPELLRLYEAAGAIEIAPATGRARKTGSALDRLGAIDPAIFDGVEPRPRQWLIDQWLPVGVVTSLYGAGGVGKSLLAMQAATAVATGTSFFGRATVQVPVLAVFCEDDSDELHRRQNAINRASGMKLGDSSALRLVARSGDSNFLVVHDAEQRQLPTELFALVERAALELGARLIILDNIAQLFPGNENDRMQVTSFLNLLTALARQIDGAVLLLGHPAKSLGSAYSGSTAWDAAVRSRWLLRRPRGRGPTTGLSTILPRPSSASCTARSRTTRAPTTPCRYAGSRALSCELVTSGKALSTKPTATFRRRARSGARRPFSRAWKSFSNRVARSRRPPGPQTTPQRR